MGRDDTRVQRGDRRQRVSELAVTCAGCGHTLDPALTLPFRCPASVPGDDIDHVLTVPAGEWSAVDQSSENPFVRYRHRTLAYRMARAHGMSDADYVSCVMNLNAAIAEVDGGGFERTPLLRAPEALWP